MPGNRLLYTATLTNTSARSVDGVGIFVRLPVGLQFHYINETEPNAACSTGINCTVGAEASWTIGSMAAGATQMITINALVLAALLDGNLIPSPFYLYATGLLAPVLLNVVVPAHR